MFQSINVKATGLTPTIMHNGQLADPLNKWAKAIKVITQKGKNKTEDDMAEIQRLEWFGGLYVNDQQAPCWPGENIEAMIRSAARLKRRGKDVERGLLVEGLVPVIYDGPADLEQLFADDRFRFTRRVVVKGNAVMRTRPIFPVWELRFSVRFDPQQVNRDDVVSWVATGFSDIGLSNWHPKYGRAECECS